MKNTNIETLKKQFDKVHLKHFRQPNDQTGATIAILVKGDTAYVGASICHAGDQFSKEIGRNISFGRALSLIEKGDSRSFTAFTLPYNADSTSETLMQAAEAVLTSNKDLV